EVVDAQAAVGLDQLVQGRRGIVGRLNVQEKTDRVVADLFANDLLLVFTHHVLQLAAVHTGPAVYSPPVRGSTQLKRGVLAKPPLAIPIMRMVFVGVRDASTSIVHRLAPGTGRRLFAAPPA